MSDSESSEEIEVKVEQQHSAKFKQLIEKAKEILPFYSEESLHHIYKQSFQNDTVFINKLNIIAKQNQNTLENDSEWIFEKKHEKQTNVRRFQLLDNRVKRQKFNFLQDTKLIQRALKFKHAPQNEREYPKKAQQQYREKLSDTQEAPRQKPYYKNQKPNNSYQKKKVLYKEKEQQVQQAQQIQQTKQVKQQTKKQKQDAPKQKQEVPKPKQEVLKEKQEVSKPTIQASKVQATKKPEAESNIKKQVKQPVALQKKQKYTEKKQPVKAPQVKKQQKLQPVPVQTQAKVEQKQPVKVKQEPKTKQVVKPKQEVKQVKQAKIQVDKIVITPKIEPLIIHQKKQRIPEQKIITEEIPSNTSINSQSSKKVESVKDVLSPQVQKQFEKSVGQNSFILSFIKPKSKLQQISYIRYPNGNMKEVKIKQPLNKRN